MSNRYLSLGSWKSIPVSLHWTVFLWLPWYYIQQKDLPGMMVSFVAFLALLASHEFGHAIAAKSRRVKVYAIKLYVMHGQCEHEEPYYEKNDVFIAWGGVLAQMTILIVALASERLVVFLPSLAYETVQAIFFTFINVNIVIIVINLIPVPPLDGAKAWRIFPLSMAWHIPEIKSKAQRIKNAFNFRQRKAMKNESERVTAELLDRLKNK
jgi:Zn-dependent protease